MYEVSVCRYERRKLTKVATQAHEKPVPVDSQRSSAAKTADTLKLVVAIELSWWYVP